MEDLSMKKRFFTLLFALVMVMGLVVSCSGNDSPAPAPEAPAPEAPAPAPEDPAPAPEDPAPAPEPDKKIIIGFAGIAETHLQHMIIRDSMQAAADARGFELVYMNNNFDGLTAVSNAQAMLERGIDIFITCNVDMSVAPTIMEAMDAAGVPVIAIDIPHPGATYFGADNYGVGPIGGEELGRQVMEKWGEEPDAMLIIEDPRSGELVLARTDNIPDGFRKIFPDFPEEKIFKIDCGEDPSIAQQRVASWLTANPTLEKIAIAPCHAIGRVGASAALDIAGRNEHGIMVSQGEYDFLEYVEAGLEERSREVYVATVVYNFREYGFYAFIAVDKILAGEPLEAEYYPKHFILNLDNVYDEYPEFFN